MDGFWLEIPAFLLNRCSWVRRSNPSIPRNNAYRFVICNRDRQKCLHCRQSREQYCSDRGTSCLGVRGWSFLPPPSFPDTPTDEQYSIAGENYRPLDVVTNSFCACGAARGDGVWLSVGGNHAVTVGPVELPSMSACLHPGCFVLRLRESQSTILLATSTGIKMGARRSVQSRHATMAHVNGPTTRRII